jgi:pimeloyl-ACP methyl ester carboxylesterase
MADGAGIGSTVVATARGDVEVVDRGTGDPVLVVHGSPGGADQGARLGEFLGDHGYRVVAPSRPGYLRTPLDDAGRSPDDQAERHLALADALGLERFSILCWSGGGPSTYRLAARHPDRVASIGALAAVSHDYRFAHPHQEGMLTGGFGRWLMAQMVRHAPKQVVSMLVTEEGDLSEEQATELVHHIWEDPAKRAFVLALSATVTGDRRAGLHNDEDQFPRIDDLGLGAVAAPVLLVHGTVDTDVAPEHSEHALGALPDADIIRVDGGTHICAWTDPTSAAIQARLVEHLRPA